MKKQLSHFAYNERSRSGWTLSIPPFTSLSPLRSTIKNCYLCPRHVCYPCLRSAHPLAKGDEGGFLVFFAFLASWRDQKNHFSCPFCAAARTARTILT